MDVDFQPGSSTGSRRVKVLRRSLASSASAGTLSGNKRRQSSERAPPLKRQKPKALQIVPKEGPPKSAIKPKTKFPSQNIQSSSSIPCTAAETAEASDNAAFSLLLSHRPNKLSSRPLNTLLQIKQRQQQLPVTKQKVHRYQNEWQHEGTAPGARQTPTLVSQQEQQPQQAKQEVQATLAALPEAADKCPICCCNLADVSHTELGRHAHVNACLDAKQLTQLSPSQEPLNGLPKHSLPVKQQRIELKEGAEQQQNHRYYHQQQYQNQDQHQQQKQQQYEYQQQQQPYDYQPQHPQHDHQQTQPYVASASVAAPGSSRQETSPPPTAAATSSTVTAHATNCIGGAGDAPAQTECEVVDATCHDDSAPWEDPEGGDHAGGFEVWGLGVNPAKEGGPDLAGLPGAQPPHSTAAAEEDMDAALDPWAATEQQQEQDQQQHSEQDQEEQDDGFEEQDVEDDDWGAATAVQLTQAQDSTATWCVP